LILAAFLLAAPAARALDLGAGLDWGTHPVGFRRLAGGASAWYPASAATASLRFADYLGAGRGDFESFLRGAGLGQTDVEALVGAPMRATLEAPAAPGHPPLVVIAQGNGEDAPDQAVLAEYLASHGYVVLTTPSPMIATPMSDESQIAAFAARQAGDLRAAVLAGERDLAFSASRIGAVGHSFGARAALLWAMGEPRVAVLVSLDGGIGTATGAEELRSAPGFDPRRCPPILHLYEDLDDFMKPDFGFLQSLRPRLETARFRGLHHAHFTTLGFAADALPGLARISHAGPSLHRDLMRVARRTRLALDAATTRR
jgi:dienelactone hydrolase